MNLISLKRIKVFIVLSEILCFPLCIQLLNFTTIRFNSRFIILLLDFVPMVVPLVLLCLLKILKLLFIKINSKASGIKSSEKQLGIHFYFIINTKLLPNLDLLEKKLASSHEHNTALQYNFCGKCLIKYLSFFICC